MNDSRDFQDAESIRSGNSHVTSRPVSFPPHPIPEGMLSRSKGMPSRKEGPPSIWDTPGISGNVFANPVASTSAPYPQELNPWSSRTEKPLHSSTVEKGERQALDQDQRCQSAQSTKNSVIFSGGDFSKNFGADQQRLQISDLHFDKFPTPATFACWKIRFKTEVCTCSQFPTEAMLWIKEVEMVDSVDDLMSSSSIRGIQMLNFEVLDAKIASALTRIIQKTQFKRKVNLEEQKAQKQDRFLRGRQIACLIHEYFRVTGANDSVENYADLFTIGLRNDVFRNSIQSGTEFYCQWRKSHLMISWEDCTIKNTRVWETQDRIGIVRSGDSSEEVRTWLSQIEDDGEKKYRARYTKTGIMGAETEIMKETPWSRIQGQNSVYKEFLEIVDNGKPTGSVLEETIAVSVTILISMEKWHSRIRLRVLSCGRMREMRREPEVAEERVPVVECLDGPARITSKELATTHSVTSGTLQNACATRPRVVADLGKVLVCTSSGWWTTQ